MSSAASDHDPVALLTVTPGHELGGETTLPGDKSLSHRAALLGALAEGETQVENFLDSGVTRVLLEALAALGVSYSLQAARLTIQGVGLKGAAQLRPDQRLDCGSSATTLRLLAGALAAWNLGAVLDGSPGLRRRPMARIVEPLRMIGVPIEAGEGGGAPLTLHPARRTLRGMAYQLPVASAQVKSCLLLAALAANGQTKLGEPGPSRDHTERMLRSMGVVIETQQLDGYWLTRLIPPYDRPLRPLNLTLPGDFSSSAFLLVAALITPGSEVLLRGVGLNPTRTGLLEALSSMGADLLVEASGETGGEPVGDIRVRHSRLHGGMVGGEQVVRMIDEFPIFAVAAAYAHGVTTVTGAEELRHKESDRISTLGQELRRIGVDFSETPDGFVIQGGRALGGGQAAAQGDHRLAMALAVAGLAAAAPVQISGAGMIEQSFPGFVPSLQRLGARLDVQRMAAA